MVAQNSHQITSESIWGQALLTDWSRVTEMLGFGPSNQASGSECLKYQTWGVESWNEELVSEV